MQVEMKVTGLMVDPLTNMPIVVLKNEESNQILPIWVGVFEANAIAMKRENVESPRPMTHDLTASLLKTLEAEVQRIVITDLKDNTFYASIHVLSQGREMIIDSRPSDAIAVALRMESPIFVEESVIEKSSSLELNKQSEDTESRLRKWFENVDPEDFSKYEM